MAIITLEFKEVYRAMGTLSLVLENYYLDPHDHNIWCSSDWAQVYLDAKFLEASMDAMEYGYLGDNVTSVHFTPGEPICENAPFTVMDVALMLDGNLILTACGQKSTRIKTKWEARFSKKCGGPVTIEWAD